MIETEATMARICAVLLATVALTVSLLLPIPVSAEGISVDSAEGTLNGSFEYSADLQGIAGGVAPRIAVGYAESIANGTLIAPAPTITSLSPDKGRQGQNLAITLTGINFEGVLANGVSFGSGITVTSFTVDSATQITVNIEIAAEASLGARDVSVENSIGIGTKTGGFAVVPPPPYISDVSPTRGIQGQTLTVTVAGTDFTGATEVSFGSGVTVDFTVDSSIQITANIAIGSSATCGTRDVSVTTISGTGKKAEAFKVMDATPPTTPVVVDDNTTTMNSSQLHATWSSSDPESGISEYQYAIGSTSEGIDILGWTSVGTNTQVTKTGLSLTVGTTYYFSVKAMNGAELWSEIGMSDGIQVVEDPTPPTTPSVTDDGDKTTNTTQLHATWFSSDAESGIVEYQYAIGTSSGATDVVDWTSSGTDTEVTHTGLSLAAGKTYYIALKANNGAGAWSDVGVSNGIAVPKDGLPYWIWIIVGGGAAALVASGIVLWRRMASKPVATS